MQSLDTWCWPSTAAWTYQTYQQQVPNTELVRGLIGPPPWLKEQTAPPRVAKIVPISDCLIERRRKKRRTNRNSVTFLGVHCIQELNTKHYTIEIKSCFALATECLHNSRRLVMGAGCWGWLFPTCESSLSSLYCIHVWDRMDHSNKILSSQSNNSA
jgi:hypothetical protein